MNYRTILTEGKDGVATVTFNRPERMNAPQWRLSKNAGFPEDVFAEGAPGTGGG